MPKTECDLNLWLAGNSIYFLIFNQKLNPTVLASNFRSKFNIKQTAKV